MRFASLGSGSRGNAAVIVEGDTCVLLDCGFSTAVVRRRLGRLGLDPTDLTAIVVTHEHSDHLGGVRRLAERYALPVWMTPGTHAAWHGEDTPPATLFSAHEPFAIGGLQLTPFPVPHDAREPCQFVFSNGSERLGILSDTGVITPFIRHQLSGCDALMVECNYDPEMLAHGPYPQMLKQRVAGRLGHLSNLQSAELLRQLDTSRLQHLVVGHVSEKNNTPALARTHAAAALDCAEQWVAVAAQDQGFDWRDILP